MQESEIINELPHLQTILKGLSVLSEQRLRFRQDTYQEYQKSKSEEAKKDFFTNLKEIYEKQVKSKLIQNIIKNHSKNFSCLLGFCKDMESVLEEASLFTLSHKSFASQSALLAFYLQRGIGQKVELAVSEDSLSQMGHLIAGDGEEDKLSFTKAALRKEGVVLHDLREWKREGVTFDPASYVVVDLFGLSPMEYAPFLLRNFTALSSCKKAIIYHSHLQDEEVQSYFSRLQAEPFPLQLWPFHPSQVNTVERQQALLQNLVDFLKEDLKHAQKHSVAIFYPLEQSLKKYTFKIRQLLNESGFKDSINIINKPHQKHDHSSSTIFILQGTQQLRQFNYDYSNLIYIIDYGTERIFTYDYDITAYVDEYGSVSFNQKAKRISLISNDDFGIYTSLSGSKLIERNQLQACKDISQYLIRMIDYGLQDYLEIDHPRVSSALALFENLHIIKSQGKTIAITNQSVLKYTKLGISPLQSIFITDFIKPQQKSQNKAIFAIIMMILIHSKESMKKIRLSEKVFLKSKPTQVWRKNGQIQSCIYSVLKCERKQYELSKQGESQSFRRNSSKIQDSQVNPFMSLYQLIDAPEGEDGSEIFSIPNFLQENSINEEVFYRIREKIDDYREIFQVTKTPVIFQKQDFSSLLQKYTMKFKECLLHYSGYVRKGYKSNVRKLRQNEICLNSDALRTQYSIKPLFVSALRYKKIQNKLQLLTWNKVHQTTYLKAMGQLPIIHKLSNMQSQIQFHGISSILFEKLWHNNGIQIEKFQSENDCYVQSNIQMACIIVHCQRQRYQQIKTKFEGLISKIKSNISASNRLSHYFGSIKFYYGAGGLIKDMVIGQYINKGLVQNLNINATVEDLYDLIEQFVIVRDINIRIPPPGQNTKSAIIYFNNQRDYHQFYDYFNDCQYMGHQLKISPMKKSKAQFAWNKQSIQFKWYVWQTHNKGLVRFQNGKDALKAVESLQASSMIDGTKIDFRLDEKDLYLDNINDITDQTYLEEIFQVYGALEQVQILKTPLRQISTELLQLENLICGTTANKNFRMQQVQKRNNGLRTCLVSFDNYQDIKLMIQKHNKSLKIIGVSRFYAVPHFEQSMQITNVLKSIVISIVNEQIQELQSLNIVHKGVVRYEIRGEQIIFYSSIKQKLDYIYTAISARMRGNGIKLSKIEKKLLFNQTALANLLDLEEKFNCKLIIEISSQTINAVCCKKVWEPLNKEIKLRINNAFFFKIYLSTKSYKYFGANEKVLEDIKKKYNLKFIELESDNQSLIIQGNLISVHNASTYLMCLIQSLFKPQQERVHSQLCGICCEEPKQPYTLQTCYHRFCIVCFQQYLRNVLGDASQFPIKCPHCMQPIIIEDLHLLLDKAQWQKLQTLAINRYMNENSQKMAFCYTAGCKQLNIFNGLIYTCDVCHFSYCNKCKEINHPGYSCDQAIEIRQTDAYFLKYMAENNIRKCPNTSCGMPVFKFDGCNKVQCTRCTKCMCFKCPPEQMIAYETPNEAYEHLNQKHGGYW